MREIAASIATGERPADAYVWWNGASEWIRFSSDPDLVELLDEHHSGTETEPAAADVDEVDEIEELVDLRQPAAATEDEVVQEEVGQERTEAPVEQDTGLAALSALGERLEALSSATRYLSTSSKLDRAGASPVEPALLDDQPVGTGPSELSDVRSKNLATTFDSLLRQSVNYERLAEQTHRVVELLARACAAAFARDSFAVERSSESPGRHVLQFTHRNGVRRARVELAPASSVGSDAQFVSVAMSWGQLTSEVDESVDVIGRQLLASIHTGTISTEIDLEDEAVLTRIKLVWPIEQYVDSEFNVDHDRLYAALDAMQQALENRWHELFSADDS